MRAGLTDEELLERVDAYVANGGRQKEAAEALGLSHNRFSESIKMARERGMLPPIGGTVEAFKSITRPLPPKGKIKRYLLTCAQNHTKVHAPFWNNLLAMREHYGAELLVSTYRYNKTAFGNTKKAKDVDKRGELESEFAAEIIPYVCNDRVDLAPRLTFVGEVQIMPTARRPLTGFESYTHRKSTIIPHTTIQMQSVASGKDEGVKLLYTTGTCTQRNYIKRREGFRAEHFHNYGALLVEVNSEGHWWCRQVEQGLDGTLYDLNLKFKGGKLVSETARAAGVTLGDIHALKVDPLVADISWRKEGNLIDTLRPYNIHVHDLLDFSPNSHHTRRDPFDRYHYYTHHDRCSVVSELKLTADTLSQMKRKWCRTVVVNSNHDRHLTQFLREIDWRQDFENAETILTLTLAALKSIRGRDDNFNMLEFALGLTGLKTADYVFLREDESDVLLKHIEGGIECGLHGDRGANGAKGSSRTFANAARRTNTADKHYGAITDGNYQAGLSGMLDMRYNKGMSSWTQSHVITYMNGKRAIVGIYAGQWRA